jgi:hypothetical protein
LRILLQQRGRLTIFEKHLIWEGTVNSVLRSLFFVSTLVLLNNCSEGLNSSDSIQSNESSSRQQFQLRMVGLEKMSGQHYEGWAIGPAGVTSTGRFNIDDLGRVVSVDTTGEVTSVMSPHNTAVFSIEDQALELTGFVLTIEPNNDTDPGPSPVHYLEGGLVNGEGFATLQEVGAIGASFLNSTGSYILATPSDDPLNHPATHNQGIWYIDSGAPGLNLPELNPSFTYEGWVVNTQTGEVLSTGTFDRVDQADSDAAGLAAGPNGTPAFPGQDYINPARELNNGEYMAVISIEPAPDHDPAPFALKVLRAPIALGAAVTTVFNMENFSNENELFIEITRP